MSNRDTVAGALSPRRLGSHQTIPCSYDEHPYRGRDDSDDVSTAENNEPKEK